MHFENKFWDYLAGNIYLQTHGMWVKNNFLEPNN